MALTLFVLSALTIAFAICIAAMLTWGIEWLSVKLHYQILFVHRLALGGTVTLVFAAIMLWKTLQKDAAETFDADPVEPREYPDFYATVTRLAQAADIPVPSVHVADRMRPLAMTTGLRTNDTKLVVSTGVLNGLSEDELDAVVAHEIAHIKNRDAAVMTLVELPLASARGLGLMFRAQLANLPLAGVAIASYAYWGIGRLLVASLSRSRELAADRGASALLGDPASLVGALETLDEDVPAAPDRDAREAALASLSIVPEKDENPGPELTYEGPHQSLWSIQLPIRRDLRWLNERFLRPALATHPATTERIERLRTLEHERVKR